MSETLDPTKEKELVELLMGLTNYADLDAIAVVSKQGVKLAYFATEESDADPDLMAAVSAALPKAQSSTVNPPSPARSLPRSRLSPLCYLATLLLCDFVTLPPDPRRTPAHRHRRGGA